jgi:hypothetical protein
MYQLEYLVQIYFQKPPRLIDHKTAHASLVSGLFSLSSHRHHLMSSMLASSCDPWSLVIADRSVGLFSLGA